MCIISSFNVWWDSLGNPSEPRAFFLSCKVINYWFNFFNTYRPIQMFVSSRVSFGRLYLSRNWSISSRLSNLWSELFSVFLYYHFNVHGIFSDSPSFISDVSCLCPLFFLVSLARGLLLILVFSKKSLLVSLIILYWFPVFNFIDFCSGSCYSFILLTLDLICSFFSSFLR